MGGERHGVVWLNGALLAGVAARIDPADRGFTLGDGVFETIRAVDGMPAHVRRHLARLRHGASVLGISVPFEDGTLCDALCAVLHANALSDAALRLTVTRGPAARGVLPAETGVATVLISAGALPTVAGPARVMTSQSTRRNEFSPLSQIKSLNYLDSIMARMEAAEQNADDAILLNTHGNVAEATAANVFLSVDGQWVTPFVMDGALPGITRGRLLEAGLVVERTVARAALDQAMAGFLANSLATRAIGWLDGRALRSPDAAMDTMTMFLKDDRMSRQAIGGREGVLS